MLWKMQQILFLLELIKELPLLGDIFLVLHKQEQLLLMVPLMVHQVEVHHQVQHIVHHIHLLEHHRVHLLLQPIYGKKHLKKNIKY